MTYARAMLSRSRTESLDGGKSRKQQPLHRTVSVFVFLCPSLPFFEEPTVWTL